MIFKNLFRRKAPANTSDPLVIVGLGNPGERYAKTRHNAGFMATDFLRTQFNLPDLHADQKFLAELSSGTIGHTKVLLVKPLTFMNASGKSVRAVLDFYKLPIASLTVIHDDVDLALGKMKNTESSSSAGHNGVQDIITTLGTQDFFRIRLGIGHPIPINGSCIPVHDYVLQPFTSDERKKINALFPKVETILKERIAK